MWIFKKQKSNKSDEKMKEFEKSRDALLDVAISTSIIAKEVTTRLKDQLDDTIEQLEITSNLLSDALIICDRDGNISSVNNAAATMFGTTTNKLLNTSITLLFRHNEAIQDFPVLLNLFYSNITNLKGKKYNSDTFHVECSVATMKRQDGSVINMILIKDVSTRVEIQKQLHVYDSRYREAFDNLYDALFIVKNFNIVAANRLASDFTGKTQDELNNIPILSFFGENMHNEFSKYHIKYMNNCTTPHTIFTRMLGKEVLVQITPMNWEGTISTLVGVKDISDIKEKMK